MLGRKKVLYFLISIVIIFFLLSELFLPGFAANMLRGVFNQEADSIDDLNINISSFPAFKILMGRIDSVEVEAEGLMIDNLYLNNINLAYRDIILEKGSFKGTNTYLETIITEESLNKYIVANYPELENFNLEISTTQVFLQGDIKFLEMFFNVQLSGNFVINDRKDIYFIPANFQIENLNIPLELLKTYIEGFDFYFNLKDLGVPVDVSEIKLNSGYIVISGGVE